MPGCDAVSQQLCARDEHLTMHVCKSQVMGNSVCWSRTVAFVSLLL